MTQANRGTTWQFMGSSSGVNVDRGITSWKDPTLTDSGDGWRHYCVEAERILEHHPKGLMIHNPYGVTVGVGEPMQVEQRLHCRDGHLPPPGAGNDPLPWAAEGFDHYMSQCMTDPLWEIIFYIGAPYLLHAEPDYQSFKSKVMYSLEDPLMMAQKAKATLTLAFDASYGQPTEENLTPGEFYFEIFGADKTVFQKTGGEGGWVNRLCDELIAEFGVTIGFEPWIRRHSTWAHGPGYGGIISAANFYTLFGEPDHGDGETNDGVHVRDGWVGPTYDPSKDQRHWADADMLQGRKLILLTQAADIGVRTAHFGGFDGNTDWGLVINGALARTWFSAPDFTAPVEWTDGTTGAVLTNYPSGIRDRNSLTPWAPPSPPMRISRNGAPGSTVTSVTTY